MQHGETLQSCEGTSSFSRKTHSERVQLLSFLALVTLPTIRIQKVGLTSRSSSIWDHNGWYSPWNASTTRTPRSKTWYPRGRPWPPGPLAGRHELLPGGFSGWVRGLICKILKDQWINDPRRFSWTSEASVVILKRDLKKWIPSMGCETPNLSGSMEIARVPTKKSTDIHSWMVQGPNKMPMVICESKLVPQWVGQCYFSGSIYIYIYSLVIPVYILISSWWISIFPRLNTHICWWIRLFVGIV